MNPTEQLFDMQSKLATARRDLSDFESCMGTLAQNNHLPHLAQRLAELQAGVTVATAAVATIQAALPNPRIATLQNSLATAQAAAEEWKQTLAHWEAELAEHEQPYIEARGKVEEAGRYVMWHEATALTQQLELSDLLPAQ